MNIKTFVNNISPVDRNTIVTPAKKSVKSEDTSPDRDPNGQNDRGKNPGKQFLNDEEMANALSKLKNFPGVKENSLKVELIVKEISRFVIISDPLGNIVRRIPEAELWPLIQEKENNKGHLIDKAG
ncbi:MAG: hypothetical protein H6625_01605 [Bdellovibrionaceae bacterium]|nr:hypothetical protein [Pseudobdellovibrionaceae bacterium]